MKPEILKLLKEDLKNEEKRLEEMRQFINRQEGISNKPKRKRRTKEQIEADKKKGAKANKEPKKEEPKAA